MIHPIPLKNHGRLDSHLHAVSAVSTSLEKEAEMSPRQRECPLQWPNHDYSPSLRSIVNAEAHKSPFPPEWPYPTDEGLLSTQSPRRVINPEAYVRYIASILDRIRDVGTRLTNQSDGSKVVGDLGTLGGQVNIHTWRSSHEIVEPVPYSSYSGLILEDFEAVNAGPQTGPVDKAIDFLYTTRRPA